MSYSTDADLEQYIPDILDHGVPGIVEGGVSTTSSVVIPKDVLSFDIADATGLQGNDYVRINKDSNVEVVQIESISTNTLSLKSSTPIRKNHPSGIKIVQVDSIGFADDHEEAKKDIDNIIEVKWYRSLVRERIRRDIELLDDDLDFDASLMLNAETQLKKASIYWTLGQYVCRKLAKYTKQPDSWERRANEFRELFEEEINRILEVGIDYDWNNNGIINKDENKLPPRGMRIGRA